MNYLIKLQSQYNNKKKNTMHFYQIVFIEKTSIVNNMLLLLRFAYLSLLKGVLRYQLKYVLVMQGCSR